VCWTKSGLCMDYSVCIPCARVNRFKVKDLAPIDSNINVLEVVSLLSVHSHTV